MALRRAGVAATGMWLCLLVSTQGAASAGPQDTLPWDVGPMRSAMGRLEFELALELGNSLLRTGRGTPEAVVELHLLLGEAAAGMGYGKGAEEAFGRALELAPDLQLPADASPKLTAPFDAARRKLGRQSLRVEVQTGWLRPGVVRSDVEVHHDAYSLVGEVRLHRPTVEVPLTLQLASSERWGVEWTCPSPCVYWLSVRDRAGNTLRTLGTPEVPLQVEEPMSAPPVAVQEQPRPSWSPRPSVYAVAAGALFVGGGSYFGWQAQTHTRKLRTILGDRASHSYDEAVALDQRRHREQRWAWGCLGGAALAGVTAVLVW